jgi:hypothetical protein
MNGKNRIVLQLSYMDKTIRSLVIGSKFPLIELVLEIIKMLWREIGYEAQTFGESGRVVLMKGS